MIPALPLLRLLTRLLLVLLLLPAAVRAADPAVAFFYGPQPPWDELRAFDVVVVDPDHSGTDPRQREQADSRVFAYVSVGEVHPSRPWFAEVPKRWQVGENKPWGSVVVDQSRPEWPAFFVDTVIAPLWDKGYRGFFLDTLDSWHLVAKTPEARSRQQAGLVAVIRLLKQRFPEARLIFNRGFEILPEVHDLAWMVAAESLFQGHDPSRNAVTEVSAPDRDWLLARLGEVRERYGLPVLVIDYVKPGQRALARQTAERIRALGMIPWVATPALDSLGVGLVGVARCGAGVGCDLKDVGAADAALLGGRCRASRWGRVVLRRFHLERLGLGHAHGKAQERCGPESRRCESAQPGGQKPWHKAFLVSCSCGCSRSARTGPGS